MYFPMLCMSEKKINLLDLTVCPILRLIFNLCFLRECINNATFCRFLNGSFEKEQQKRHLLP